ncbi:hypothetical protein [Granulicella sp. L60]|uniref:hypothetical protein n=1 Tax=Granulicella sp. L60 TaxID=1641866 RepID=UPI00131CF831|nr:hypothetical protein [Granulicella sp. L60]
MKAGATLYAEKINNGQSEIWVAADDEVLTESRRLATNEIINVTRRLCTAEAFKAFYPDQHLAVGHIRTLTVPNLDEIVAELRLTPLK